MSQMSCQLARSDWSAADDAVLVLSASSNASAGSCSFKPQPGSLGGQTGLCVPASA